jgi:hypothetical protein
MTREERIAIFAKALLELGVQLRDRNENPPLSDEENVRQLAESLLDDYRRDNGHELDVSDLIQKETSDRE